MDAVTEVHSMTGESEVPSNTVEVPLKGGVSLTVDTVFIPDAMLPMIYVHGLKAILGARMSKLTKAAYPHRGDLEAKVLEVAKENLQNLYQGKVRIGNKVFGKADKEPAAVVTEAKRLAKVRVKDELRASGHKISHIPAKDITALATIMVQRDPIWLAKAKSSLADAASVVISGIDFKSAVKADPKLVAKAEASNKRLKQLSAAKSGGTAKRRKPADQHAH